MEMLKGECTFTSVHTEKISIRATPNTPKHTHAYTQTIRINGDTVVVCFQAEVIIRHNGKCLKGVST